MANGSKSRYLSFVGELFSSTLPGQHLPQHPSVVTFGTEPRRIRVPKKESKKLLMFVGKKASYRGPARDVSRGHLLQREDGGLVIAKGVKFNVQEQDSELRDLLPPITAEGMELQEEDNVPTTKKQLEEEIEFTSRYLLNENNYDLEEVLKLYNKLEELGDTDMRIGKKVSVTSWYTGAFVHGGVAGVRRNLSKFPHTTRYLVGVGKKYCDGTNFSALGLARNSTLGMHRDVHNVRNSKNVVIPLTSFTGGSLWTVDPEVPDNEAVFRKLPNGSEAKGRGD